MSFKNYISLHLIGIFILLSCNNQNETQIEEEFKSTITSVTTLFDLDEFKFENAEKLLEEIRICDPTLSDSSKNIIRGTVPCSPSYFAFYEYNHNQTIDNAFVLQVRKGVNDFDYRRMLIFTRENGNLVLMNGVVGYLVEKRTRPNGIDDLLVAIVDNIGGKYERYDVLLRYEAGKYHFHEAVGDLQGVFDDEDLKKRATVAIEKRIKQKKLIF